MASLSKFLPSRLRSYTGSPPSEPTNQPVRNSHSDLPAKELEERGSSEKDSLKAVDDNGVVIQEAEKVSPGDLTLEEGSCWRIPHLTYTHYIST
jgi:hypothetical protein